MSTGQLQGLACGDLEHLVFSGLHLSTPRQQNFEFAAILELPVLECTFSWAFPAQPATNLLFATARLPELLAQTSHGLLNAKEEIQHCSPFQRTFVFIVETEFPQVVSGRPCAKASVSRWRSRSARLSKNYFKELLSSNLDLRLELIRPIPLVRLSPESVLALSTDIKFNVFLVCTLLDVRAGYCPVIKGWTHSAFGPLLQWCSSPKWIRGMERKARVLL